MTQTGKLCIFALKNPNFAQFLNILRDRAVTRLHLLKTLSGSSLDKMRYLMYQVTFSIFRKRRKKQKRGKGEGGRRKEGGKGRNTERKKGR